jgi:hypothetical protein
MLNCNRGDWAEVAVAFAEWRTLANQQIPRARHRNFADSRLFAFVAFGQQVRPTTKAIFYGLDSINLPLSIMMEF